MKLSKRQLKRIIRKTINESGIEPRPQHPMYAAANERALEQAQIEDALIKCFCDFLADGATSAMPFHQFVDEVCDELGTTPESLAQSCELISSGAI